MTCTRTMSVGAYLLGALDGAEVDQLQDHFDGCALCREELTGLAALPGLLGLLTVSDVERITAEDDEPESVGANRTQRRTVRVAAALAAAGAVVASWLAFASPAPNPAAVTASSVPAPGDAHAKVQLTPRSWGTAIRLHLSAAYPGGTCSLIVHAAGGRHETAATWKATEDGQADLPATTSIRLTDITSLDVVTTTGWELARIPLRHSN